MKYLKTYEGKLEDIEKIHFCKLSILNFSKKISYILKNFGFKTRLNEQDAPHTYIAQYRLSSGGDTVIIFNILSNKIIQIRVYSFKFNNFEDFIIDFLNQGKDKDTFGYRENYFSFNYNELNNITEKLIDEWELFTNIKKYNL